MTPIILAAGMGTRLRPLTDERPKSLVEICGQSILDWQLNVINKSIHPKDIYLVGGYRVSQYRKYPVHVIENNLFASTNMVYSLYLALRETPIVDDILIVYGDIVFEPRILKAICSANHNMRLAVDTRWNDLWSLRFADPLMDAETLIYNQKLEIQEIGKRTNSLSRIQAQYMGLIVFEKNIINDLKKNLALLFADEKSLLENGQMYMTDFIQLLIDKGSVCQAVLCDGGWLEIDSVNDLNLYNEMENKNELSAFWRTGSCVK